MKRDRGHGGAEAVWILEDQLSPELSSLASASPDAPVLLVESRRAFSLVPYHKKRLAFLVSAMRHFAEELRAGGRAVHEYTLARRPYLDSLSALRHFIESTGIRSFVVTEPSEFHTRAWMQTLPARLGIEIRFVPNNLFLTDRAEFRDWVRAVKKPVMEHFYRRMRVRYRVLMDGQQPVGGQWNLDHENRKPAPRGLLVPPPPAFAPDSMTQEALVSVDGMFPAHPGNTQGFNLPVTRTDARKALASFLRSRLPRFGEFEDAMLTGQPVLFHSFLSPLINVGLLSPMECIRGACAELEAGRAPLNSVEGFVRQILGWREYMYGMYWAFMPDYRDRNARGDTRPLPDFFWTAEAEMNCLRQTIGQVVEMAYSHHIQRLMVICNFSTLAGLSPQAVNEWFLAMYVDSHDWVVTPNVIGMGMNADGGLVATKPYVSSAAYIKRMSDYCDGCRFDPKARTGSRACPFNFLFWTFLDRYRAHFERNPRMGMMLKNLSRVPEDEREAMRRARNAFLRGMDRGVRTESAPPLATAQDDAAPRRVVRRDPPTARKRPRNRPEV